jgi:hypothetical protein
VAGYRFNGSDVVGNCSYCTVSGVPGKGGGRTPAKNYAQTCTWDIHGNLLSITPGALAVRKLIVTKGRQIIYAIGVNGEYTGKDSKQPERGFVGSPGSHYTWLTPNHNVVLHQIVYSLRATLKSDGDMPAAVNR